jgi:hypothetical protein
LFRFDDGQPQQVGISNGECVFRLVYVDDGLVTGSSPELIASVKNQLKERFEMTESGVCKFVLGIEGSSLTVQFVSAQQLPLPMKQ